MRLEVCRSCRCHIEIGLDCPFCGAGAAQASSLDSRWLGLAVPLLAIVGCGNPGPQDAIYGTPEMIDRRKDKEPDAPAPAGEPAVGENRTSDTKAADGESPDPTAQAAEKDAAKVVPQAVDATAKPPTP